MKFTTYIDIIAWVGAGYWMLYIPNDKFSIDTNPVLVTIAMGLLTWRCLPYIIVLEEYD